MSLSSLVYLLPVVLMLLFAIACEFLLHGTDVLIAVAALIGLGTGFGICRTTARWLAPLVRTQVSVVANPGTR